MHIHIRQDQIEQLYSSSQKKVVFITGLLVYMVCNPVLSPSVRSTVQKGLAN
jgi:nucleoside diphosphate kinase